MKNKLSKSIILTAALFFFINNSISAHCDSVEGPVVKAAEEALNSGNINHVLIWIPAENENELKELFQKVSGIRNINESVREIADLYFYETVVRIHRMGEGVGYTGLKGKDFKPEEGIEAADLAIRNNSVEEILSHVDESKHEKIKNYFSGLQSKKNFEVNNVAAGREYVSSYVHFIHYIESLFTGKTNTHNHRVH
ncbi:MAG: hypothetical protein F9K45_08825 [Melioribacteraceae bacterium]|nr:MAG: hypothetical protein F9K45_08825 [Melioribacteraceae bacterium]